MTSENKQGDVVEILKKYGAKIEGQINASENTGKDYSREYLKFKSEIAPELNRYEKWCHSLGNVIKIKVSQKDEEKTRKSIDIAHLEIEPWQAGTLSIMAFLGLFFVGLLISISIVLVKGNISEFPFLFFILVTVASVFLFYFVGGYPARIAAKWRLKVSSQMVPAILYIVVYMRHTPNLERAIAFASENLQPPLALDFKKVFYDVQVGKYSTIKESLDSYLKRWKNYSPEFIESFDLIESSLYEPNSARRILILEKALQVVLDGVYDRMLKFTHDVRAPL